MAFYKQKQNWLMALGATITLLWTAQLAADWFKPDSEIELTQHQKVELAHTIQFERNESSRTFKLESKTDPVSLISSATAPIDSGAGFKLGLNTTTFVLKFHTTGLPGIRAPPYFIASA